MSDIQVVRLRLLAVALDPDADDLSGRARPRVRAAKLELDEAAKRIVALLAERDGLKTRLMDADLYAETLILKLREAHKTLSASNAALADALRLLREPKHDLDEDGYIRLMTPGDEAKWLERRDAFLAKHGPSPWGDEDDLQPTSPPIGTVAEWREYRRQVDALNKATDAQIASRPQEQPRKATGEEIEAAMGAAAAEMFGGEITLRTRRVVIAALNAAFALSVSPAAAQGWQTIETAPKDGSTIYIRLDWGQPAFWDDELQCWVLHHRFDVGSLRPKDKAQWKPYPAAPPSPQKQEKGEQT